MMNIRGLSNDDPYVYESCRELPTIQFRGGSTPARSQSAAGTDLCPMESRECPEQLGSFWTSCLYTRNRRDLGYCLNYILNIRLYTIYICMNSGDSACGLILSTVSLKLPWLVMDMARPQAKSQARPKMTAWGWLWPGLLLKSQSQAQVGIRARGDTYVGYAHRSYLRGQVVIYIWG